MLKAPGELQSETLVPRAVWGKRFASSLQPRTVGLADVTTWPAWRAVHIEHGTIQIVSGNEPTTHRGPCLAWIPWTRDSRLRIMAGTAGAHVLMGNSALSNAIGYKAESADLQAVADHQYVLPLERTGAATPAVAQCFEGVLREIESMAASANTVIEAFIRIVLIEIWRSQGAPGSYDSAANPSQRTMNRFNALVESRFRDRWSVADYARQLGISADRLTDICRRFRGLPPKKLINARVETEARLLLEDSTHSVEQVAGLLGFPSSAQFNRFFSKQCGVPPGNYRRVMRARRRERPERPSLHEWP